MSDLRSAVEARLRDALSDADKADHYGMPGRARGWAEVRSDDLRAILAANATSSGPEDGGLSEDEWWVLGDTLVEHWRTTWDTGFSRDSSMVLSTIRAITPAVERILFARLAAVEQRGGLSGVLAETLRGVVLGLTDEQRAECGEILAAAVEQRAVDARAEGERIAQAIEALQPPSLYGPPDMIAVEIAARIARGDA